MNDERRSQACAPDVDIAYRTSCNSSAWRYTQLELVAELAELGLGATEKSSEFREGKSVVTL
jgi:hypothetical protein